MPKICDIIHKTNEFTKFNHLNFHIDEDLCEIDSTLKDVKLVDEFTVSIPWKNGKCVKLFNDPEKQILLNIDFQLMIWDDESITIFPKRSGFDIDLTHLDEFVTTQIPYRLHYQRGIIWQYHEPLVCLAIHIKPNLLLLSYQYENDHKEWQIDYNSNLSIAENLSIN